MKFEPYFCELKNGKNYVYLIHYSEHSTIELKNDFSEISGTFSGVRVNGYVENIRGLLYAYPNFFEVVGVDPLKELAMLGFKKVDPGLLEVILHNY